MSDGLSIFVKLNLDMNLDNNFFEWIEANRMINPSKLRLKYLSSKNGYDDYKEIAIGHIQSLQKGGRKLENLKNNGLAPEILYPSFALEQCSSAETAKIHLNFADKFYKKNSSGKVLDLTCGLGIDALNFALNGYEVVALEINDMQAEIATYNYRNIKNMSVINEDCVIFLSRIKDKFNMIFIDPARRRGSDKRLYNISSCSPDLIELFPLIKEHTDVLIAKLSPMLDIKQTLKDLPGVTELHVVGCSGECKEIVVIFDFTKPDFRPVEEIPIFIDSDKETELLSFTLDSESKYNKFEIFTTPSKENDYLFIPDAIVMKAGCFATLSNRCGLSRIAKNTHIFVGKTPLTKFPGKKYHIQEILPYNKNSLRDIIKRWPEVSVSCKNFILSSEELKKRLKLKESDKYQLFACTDSIGSKLLIMTEKS